VSIVRTVLNRVVGVPEMRARTLPIWSVIGGLVWIEGSNALGYAFGDSTPAAPIDTSLLPIVAAVVVISLSLLAVEVLRSRCGASQPPPEHLNHSRRRAGPRGQPARGARPDERTEP
jgi:membrane-associated protein